MDPIEEYKPPPLPSPFFNTNPAPSLITQGAEAHLYKTVSLNPSIPAALKIRPSKPYRHPILDRRLTRQRIIQEARCLVKLVREGVNVPAVLALDWEGQGGESGWGGAWLLMEWIEGPVIRVVLEQWEAWMKENKASLDQTQLEQEEARVRDLLKRIGFTLGGLHKAGVVHGDLTTSNLMLRPPAQPLEGNEIQNGASMEGEIVLIDFGLASQSLQDEDRAVDLYVLERAIGSTHPRSEPLFDELLQGYRESHKGAKATLRRLEDVRMRGRKRSMLG
ncbi:EKC/KEOPS complex subunit [Penicillium taxi]|uniref:EKC/KEOPS complex subunit n=1 Tax=Penicillium taxi TaxID=168475 RepID=UPI002544FA57|nr:EKC/KEOPS complex subunit [Penicillium taxi]KAJ5888549.1 EKC/KEOPS complex subunit [Penicillium taxi]